jgi:hypothetical protein
MLGRAGSKGHLHVATGTVASIAASQTPLWFVFGKGLDHGRVRSYVASNLRLFAIASITKLDGGRGGSSTIAYPHNPRSGNPGRLFWVVNLWHD